MADYLLDQDDGTLDWKATKLLPGSDEKIALMAKRVAAGLLPCHEEDKRMPLGWGWHIVVGKNGRVMSKTLVKNQGCVLLVEEVEESLDLATAI